MPIPITADASSSVKKAKKRKTLTATGKKSKITMKKLHGSNLQTSALSSLMQESGCPPSSATVTQKVPVLQDLDLFCDEEFAEFFTPPEELVCVTPPTVSSFDEQQQVAFEKEKKHLESMTVTVPAYMKLTPMHPCDDYFMQMLERLRCKRCFRFLCCASSGMHDVNCWIHEFIGVIREKDLHAINQYTFDVLAGKLAHFSHYTFGFFERQRHVKADKEFNAARLGLFVRCMLCKSCSKSEFDCCLPTHYH